MSPSANPSLRTGAASAYLAERGIHASPSYLQKARTRGPDDPRDSGPDFLRDEIGRCWYTVAALDRYINERLKARKFRAAASQPANFWRV
jgi:hypothetical protein